MGYKKPLLEINIGDVFGDLKCVDIMHIRNNSGMMVNKYLMKCLKCGREKCMLSSTIRLGHGIFYKACGKGLKTLDSVFYNKWEALRTRTINPNYEHADRYLERGINSDEFANFIDFYDAMHDSYLEAIEKYGKENVSIDRIDNDGNYCKSNCRWIHKNEQQNNTSRTVKFIAEFPDGTKETWKGVNAFCRAHSEYNISCVHDALSGRLKQYLNTKFFRL